MRSSVAAEPTSGAVSAALTYTHVELLITMPGVTRSVAKLSKLLRIVQALGPLVVERVPNPKPVSSNVAPGSGVIVTEK